jgi:predicted HTH transcriptional regulator
VTLLFENPTLTSAVVREHLGVTTQGALNLIRSLESRGWLEQIGTGGRGGGKWWLAPEIFDVMAGDLAAEAAHVDHLN